MLNPTSKIVAEKIKEHVLEHYANLYDISKKQAVEKIYENIEANIEQYTPYNLAYNEVKSGNYLIYDEDISNLLKDIMEMDEYEQEIMDTNTNRMLYKHLIGVVYQNIYERR